jgi:hypothetical protein
MGLQTTKALAVTTLLQAKPLHLATMTLMTQVA